MIILDKPYVSELLKNTISDNNFKLLETNFSKKLNFKTNPEFISEKEAVKELDVTESPLIYSNSENAISWINANLSNTLLPQRINIFKDKIRFRELIADIYPDFFFKEVNLIDVDSLDINKIPKPFIIKPSVGFFSMGVYKIENNNDWDIFLQSIKKEIKNTKGLYPEDVVNSDKFIIEQMIEGDEYAFDLYYNDKGEPVVLGIFKHLFASSDDVSDRVYFTNKNIINDNIKMFTEFGEKLGERTSLKNFPVHIEVRVSNNKMIPIEVNPMRFGGWCTTADLTAFAYNLNPYEYYFNQKKPDWEMILKNKDNLNYSMIILDNSTGYKVEEITDFDYNALLKEFSNPLDLRKTDWNEYPVFGILFTESHDDKFDEIINILTSDLKEFVKTI